MHTRLLVILISLLLPVLAFGQVTHQATTADATLASATTTLTYSHTVTAGESDYVTFIGVSYNCNAGCPATVTATFNGDAATLHAASEGVSDIGVKLFRLVNPDQVTGDVVITTADNRRIISGAMTFFNVDQTTPLGTADTDNNSSTTTLTCTSTVASNGQVVAVAAKRDTTEALVTSTGTERYNDQTTAAAADNNVIGAGSTIATVGSQNMTFTASTARDMACLSAPINPVTVAGASNRGLPLWFQ